MGVGVKGLESITDEHVILPKLVLRLVEYLEGGGSAKGPRVQEFVAKFR